MAYFFHANPAETLRLPIRTLAEWESHAHRIAQEIKDANHGG